MDKDYYHEVLLPEIVRYSKIRSMDPENLDEYGAAVFATWYTRNPLGCADRDYICNFDEPQEPVISDKKSAMEAFGNPRLGEDPPTPKKPKSRKKSKGIRFTAHTHPDEPLVPSPDDLLVYSRFDSAIARAKEQLVHFIIDGYTCRKAEIPAK